MFFFLSSLRYDLTKYQLRYVADSQNRALVLIVIIICPLYNQSVVETRSVAYRMRLHHTINIDNVFFIN